MGIKLASHAYDQKNEPIDRSCQPTSHKNLLAHLFGLNLPITIVQAKKFLAERSPLYMTARTVLRDLKLQTEPLVAMPIPPRPTRSEADRALVINWKKYLKWEESNPLDIEEPAALQARVGYALRKCLTQMRFFPELW
jgi:cleavage stimulation factor subunit 3